MDPVIIDHFKKADPILYRATQKVLATSGPFTMSVDDDPFAALCDHIISQQLSIKAADTILARFADLFPNRKIEPKKTLDFSDDQLRAIGFSRAKVTYVKDLGQRIVDGVIELDRFAELDDDTIKTELVKVKGIGPWTAEMFLIFNLDRPDVFSPGDLGLRNAIKKLYGLEDLKEPALIALAAKWSPYKSYACRILWRSLSLT